MLRISLFAIALLPAIANASFSTDQSIGTDVLKFDEHPNQELTLGPVTLTANSGALVSFTASNSFEAAGFSGILYGLGTNGVWSNDAYSFAWVNGSEDGGYSSKMTFTFLSGPVSFVGGLINYSPGEEGYYDAKAVSINALGKNGNVLEAYSLEGIAPIRTPGQGNVGDFRGIARATADIYAFQIQGASVVRTISFSSSPSPVPEASAELLAVFGLATVFVLSSRGARA